MREIKLPIEENRPPESVYHDRFDVIEELFDVWRFLKVTYRKQGNSHLRIASIHRSFLINYRISDIFSISNLTLIPESSLFPEDPNFQYFNIILFQLHGI